MSKIKAVNFSDLTDRQKQEEVYRVYIDLAFCDPLYQEGAIICPSPPVGRDAVGLDVVMYTGQSSHDIGIDYLVHGKVVSQADSEVQINLDGVSYVCSVYHCAVLQ